ncbi:Large ribosomal subunit protein [Trichinella spiralis]|uniref:Large ribosomal subunit protein n=1 Tax=Trichinella spiralis TaxID=6334 RepID=A0ABR3K506_TRISP
MELEAVDYLFVCRYLANLYYSSAAVDACACWKAVLCVSQKKERGKKFLLLIVCLCAFCLFFKIISTSFSDRRRRHRLALVSDSCLAPNGEKWLLTFTSGARFGESVSFEAVQSRLSPSLWRVIVAFSTTSFSHFSQHCFF